MFKLFKKGNANSGTSRKNKTVNTGKVSKKKRVRMKRRKANFPILSLLEIPKTVPITIQGELDAFSKNLDGAVRKAKNGYTVIALTYEQLEKSGLKDAEDDDFGQFSLGLRGDTIRSATRIEDLELGNIIFIPNVDTIHALSEYDTLTKDGIFFNWAIYPKNPETIDQSETEIKEKTVTINELLHIIDEPGYMEPILATNFEVEEIETPQIPSAVTNSETEKEEAAPTELEETVVYDDELDDTETNINRDEPSLNETNETVQVDEEIEEQSELPTYSIPEDPEEFEESEVGMHNDLKDNFNENDGAENLVIEDEIIDEYDETGMAGQEKEMREVIEPDDFKNELIELSNRIIEDPDIRFEVRTEDFNVLFGTRKPYHFKLTDSELLLNTMLNEKRQQYNSELARIHEMNTQQLAQAYTSRMDSAVSKARAILDDNSIDTESGKERQRIEEKFKEDNAQLDGFLEHQNNEKISKYEAEREEHANAIKQKALADYDLLHKDTLMRSLNETKEEFLSGNRLVRNLNLKDLHEKRQKVANRLIDDTHRQVIQDLQNVYQMMMEDEEEIRQQMENEITDYMHKHFKDDTMRNEALAEKLRQETEASRVRKEMEERMKDNQKFIENMQAQADANIETIQREHRVFVEQMQMEYNREMQAKSELLSEREAALKLKDSEAKEQLKEQRKDSQMMLKEAKKQYESKLDVLRDTMDSQTKVIETFKSKKDKRLTSVILGSLGLITALVLVFLFLFTQQYANTSVAKPSEITLTTNSPLLNSEEAEIKEATTSNEDGDEVIDAYVATATNKKEPSVIVGFKDNYKTGDEVNIIGSMEGGSVSGSLTVTGVKDNTVSLESTDKVKYSFVATK